MTVSTVFSGIKEATSETGMGWLRYAVAKRLGWIFREQPNQDKGVDAQVEEVLDGRATGRLIGLQVKSGRSWLKHRARSGYLYRGDLEHLTYWQGHSLPLIIVLFDPDASEAYWQLVSDNRVRRTPRGWTIGVPFTQRIDNQTSTDWHQICLPETARRFLLRKRKFEDIAYAFTAHPEQRQTLLYEALNLSRRSICLSTPHITADILAVLDYVAVKCLVRILVGPRQPDGAWDLLRARSRPEFAIRICTDLHLKLAIFDSLFVLKGSANLTSIGIVHKAEQFSVAVDESRTEIALDEFFKVWNELGSPVPYAQELTAKNRQD